MNNTEGRRYRIIIAGGRDFDDFDFLYTEMNKIISNFENKDRIEIVSGHAAGADTLGERYAIVCGYFCSLWPAEWNKYGKSAGYIRNKKMGDYADMLVAFWDGKSRGTKNMIDYAIKKGLNVIIVNYKKNI